MSVIMTFYIQHTLTIPPKSKRFLYKIKTLTFAKIIHLTLVTNETTATIELLSKLQKEFLWGKNKSKIKHDTL